MVKDMKYIIDLDAFKECLHLLRHPILKYSIIDAVYVNDVIELLNKFPKEKYKENWEIKQEAWEIEQKGREAGLEALDMIHKKRKEVEQGNINPLTSKIDTNIILNPLTSKL